MVNAMEKTKGGRKSPLSVGYVLAIKFALCCLAVMLVLMLSMVLPRPSEGCGMKLASLWIAVEIDYEVSPAFAGSISITPPTVVDGKNYWGHGATLTVVPDEGWYVHSWNLPAANGWTWVDWVDETDWNTCVVGLQSNYDQQVAIANSGCYEITANLRRYAVPLTLQRATGFDWQVTTGSRSVALDSIVPIEVELAAGYDTLYEFGGWEHNFPLGVGSQPVHDPTSANTHIDMDTLYFGTTPADTSYWIRPILKPLEGLSDVTITSTDNIGDVRITPEGELEDPPVLLEDQEIKTPIQIQWLSDNETGDYEFVRWELVNMDCSNPTSAICHVMPKAAGASSATALLVEAAETEYDLTIIHEGDGTTVPGEGTYTYTYGTSVTLRATAAEGWEFKYWRDINGVSQVYQPVVQHVVIEDTDVTAVFERKSGGDSGGAATGIWGKIQDTIDGVGLGNSMGRMFVVLAGMVAAFIVFRKSDKLRVIGPLGVLGVGIIGGWVPIWIIVLLALGAGVWIFQRTARAAGGE